HGQDRIVLSPGFLEPPERDAFLSQGFAIRDGVSDFELVLEGPVGLFRVERTPDAGARLLPAIGAKPFGNQLDYHIGERAPERNHENDIAPGREPPCLRRMHNQCDIDRQQQSTEDWHGGPQHARDGLRARKRADSYAFSRTTSGPSSSSTGHTDKLIQILSDFVGVRGLGSSALRGPGKAHARRWDPGPLRRDFPDAASYQARCRVG